PIPRTHVAGRKRHIASLLARNQPRVRSRQFCGALADTMLQFGIELLQFLGFTIELDENLDLGPEHFRHYGHRHVIDRAHLIASEMIDLGELDGRNKNYGDLLETWMLANHGGEFKAVLLG